MKPLHFVVGSVTGTSRGFACDLREKLASTYKIHFHEYSTLDDVLIAPTQTVVFFVSNTGAGEFSPYLRRIYLQLTRQQYLLPDCEYLILNFGDSRYKEFGTAGFLLDDALRNAGAKPLSDILTLDAYNNNHTDIPIYDWVMNNLPE